MDDAFERVLVTWYVGKNLETPKDDLTLQVSHEGHIQLVNTSQGQKKRWPRINVHNFVPSAVHDKISKDSDYVRNYALHIIEKILSACRSISS